MSAGRNILVTGGCGFIGANFIRAALRSLTVTRLVNLDALTYAGRPENLPAEIVSDPRYVFARGDINDAPLTLSLLRAHAIDTVIHLAAESHVDRAIDNPAPFVRTNVAGTVALLESALAHWRSQSAAARKNFRFAHISTDEVYGALTADGQPFSESSPYAPANPYAASKAAADHFAWSFHKTHGLPLMVSHCGNNYGPRQLPEKLIPRMIGDALAGRPLTVYGDGANMRDWIYVDDYAAGLLALLAGGRNGGRYHFGGGRELSNLQVTREICALLDELSPSAEGDRQRLIRFVADRPGHDFRYAMNTTKARTELGWVPRVDFAAGLRLTVAWYLRHPERLHAADRYQRQTR
ncbi:MAG: dTDP-glucose 4,6-dehydratase [Verrucomicrobiales bacterium]|jgi:dTDP-glucose 4,6-dehydratase|nr:dTDP-glucose 4,6-dehydratase [Verrucomicrobiales bacterium]